MPNGNSTSISPPHHHLPRPPPPPPSFSKAETVGSAASLHVTLSTGQHNAWVDLLELLVPAALAAEAEASLSLRQGLPFDYLE